MNGAGFRSAAASEDARRSSLLRAVLARMTWRVPVSAVGIGILFNALRFLEASNYPDAQPDELYVSTAVMQMLGALSIIVATIVADEAVARGARRWLAYSTALVAGALVASLVQSYVRSWLGLRVQMDILEVPREVVMMQPLVFFFELCTWGAIGVFLYVSYRRARGTAAHLHATGIQRTIAQRRTFEMRLKALQARVEPQFLLDTLVRVRDLYDRDPDAGGPMLDELIGYLRAALPQLRDSTSTLGREVALAGAYVRIARLRGPAELRVDFDVPEALRRSRMPPMLLLPLCAVLVRVPVPDAPRPSLRVAAKTRGGKVTLVAAVSGREDLSSSDRESIAALQERLGSLHGASASLDVERHGLDGWCATLSIPHETADGDHR